MNQVILRGNLTRDVELKEGRNGKSVARFGIAVRRDFKNADGEYESDFMNCIAFGNQADTINTYLHKGSGIIINGRLQTGSYEREDGTKVSTTDVIVEKFEFDRKVESKKEEPLENKTDSEIIAEVVKEDPYEEFGKQIEIDESDLPF